MEKKDDETEKKRTVGRPRFQIDYDLVLNLAEIMCTQEEIASILGCSVDTLQRNKKFYTVYNKGLDSAKMSLRRKQLKLAESNATMAIFLGKNYLGQKDKTELDSRHSGEISVKLEGELEEWAK